MIQIIQTGHRVNPQVDNDGNLKYIDFHVDPPVPNAQILFVDMPSTREGWASITWKVEMP